MNRTTEPSTLPWLDTLREYMPLLSAATMTLALVAGYLGQRGLDRRSSVPGSWTLLLIGAGAFALLACQEALERRETGDALATQAPRAVPFALALVLAAVAFPGFAGNRFRLLPTLAWLAGLGLLYFSFREPSAGPAPEDRSERRPFPGELYLSWHALVLVAILLVAALLRLYHLEAIPREMGTDMPLKYENAREIMQGQFMIFCPRYPGREALFFYLVAAYGKLFGLGYFAIKFSTVLLGLATIPVLYGVARYLFDRQVAIVAAALLAVSKWHVILSRSGYRAILMPLFVAILIYATVRALRSGRASDFVVAGGVLGLGMYTYNAFLVAPPVLALVLGVELVLRRRALRRYLWGFVGLGLAALLVFLPLGRYASEVPQAYIFRVATRISGIEKPLPADLIGVFAGNLWRAAGMFNLQGDRVFYNNVPLQRQLGAVSGVLLVCGLAYALWRWREGHNAMILIFLVGMILPTALSLAFPNEVPNAGRAAGVLTPVYLLAALPLVALRRHLAALRLAPLRWLHSPRLRLAGLLAPVALVAVVGLEFGETWQAYFQDYVRHLPRRNYAISLEIARVLDAFDPEGPAYVVIWPYWFDGNALRAQLKVKSPSWDWEIPKLDPDKPPLATVRGKVLFIVHPEDRQTLQQLYAAFPRGVAVNHRDYGGQVAFVAFYGER